MNRWWCDEVELKLSFFEGLEMDGYGVQVPSSRRRGNGEFGVYSLLGTLLHTGGEYFWSAGSCFGAGQNSTVLWSERYLFTAGLVGGLFVPASDVEPRCGVDPLHGLFTCHSK